jgi:hypothetical protein
MLTHKLGHRVDAFTGQGSEDTERTGEDAKLVAQRDADALLAVVHRQYPPRLKTNSPSRAYRGRGLGGEGRGVPRHFGDWTETSTR